MLGSLRRAAQGAPGAWPRAIVLGALAAAAEVGLAIAFAMLARVVRGDLGSVGWVALALAVCASGRVLAQVAMGNLGTRAAIETTRRLRRVGLDAILRADARGSEPAADALTRFLELVPRASQAQQAVLALAAQSVQAGILAALVIASAPGLGVVMLAVLAGTGVIANLAMRRVRSTAEGLAGSQRRVASALERITRHVLEIRALRTVGAERARLAGIVDDHAALQGEVARRSAIASAMPVLIAVIVIAALAGIALETGVDGARLVAMLYALVRLATLLAAAGQTVGVVASAAPALETLHAEPAMEERSAASAREGGAAGIALEGVVVELGGRRVLAGIDLRAAPGEVIAITGPSGIGKTTLLRVVLGLIEPATGRAAIDGESPGEWAARGGRIGLVGAEPMLFAGTLRENLAYGIVPPPHDVALRAALARVSAASVADRGLDFAIGERGEGLSTGERQRVALARAIAGAPGLLVLDEPTSGLDAKLEGEIAELVATLAGGCTVLVATHRPALLRACDRVIEIVPAEDGATIRAEDARGRAAEAS